MKERMPNIRLIFTALICFITSWTVNAQSYRLITVSADEPYTDHLTLRHDSRDMDLMLKFVFNEEENQLTVSLISYRDLFVFQQDVRYSQIVSRWRKLHPQKFPYVVAADEGQTFKLRRDFKNTLPTPRRKHIFKSWMNYEGMLPVPAELQMCNDVIEQTFDIKDKRDEVSFSLHDVFLMEHDAKNNNKLWITYGKDLNTIYQINIERNPCFGLEEELKIAAQAKADLAKAHKNFMTRYASKKVGSEDALALFRKSKEILIQQFARHSADSPCPTLRETWQDYNEMLDQIAKMECKLELQDDLLTDENGNARSFIPPSSIRARARQIDSYVSRWLLSEDISERHDLIATCQKMINDTQQIIRKHPARTSEQWQAYDLFRRAVIYFNTTCKNQYQP